MSTSTSTATPATAPISHLSPAAQRIQTTFIDPLLAAHKPYEAEQQYKVHATRLTHKKQYNDASMLLYRGALLLLKAGQANAGSELASLYIQSIARASSHESTADVSCYVSSIVQLAHTFDAADWKLAVDFLKKASSWAAKASSGDTAMHGDSHNASDATDTSSSTSSSTCVAQLQQAIARLYTEHQQYQQANVHFIRTGSSSVSEHAAMLSEWMQQGRPDEADAFIARTVLQYLSVGQVDAAQQLFNSMRQRLTPDAYKAFPLLHFLYILLQLLQMQLPAQQKSTLYTQLCEHYAKALEYDAQWKQYLKVIGEEQFNVSSQNALLQMLGSQLFGGTAAAT